MEAFKEQGYPDPCIVFEFPGGNAYTVTKMDLISKTNGIYSIHLPESFSFKAYNSSNHDMILYVKITDSDGKVVKEEQAAPYEWLMVSN